MTFCADIHCPLAINPRDFGDVLTVPPALLTGQKCLCIMENTSTSTRWVDTIFFTDIHGSWMSWLWF